MLHRVDLALRGRRRNVSSFATGFPVLYLTARGRRSGEPRTVPLLYLRDGDVLAVAGTNWGREHAPAWSLNLDAGPDAEVELDGETRSVRARRATGAEWDGYWPKLVEIWPGYASYAKRAGREIPLHVLEPR